MPELTVRGHLTAAINAFPSETQGAWELSVLNHIGAAIGLIEDADREVIGHTTRYYTSRRIIQDEPGFIPEAVPA